MLQRTYAPSEDTLRWCFHCAHWYHLVCLSRAPPLLVDAHGTLNTSQPNLAWVPQTPDQNQWATLIRSPITRFSLTSASLSTTNVLSLELILGPARQYHLAHGGPPPDMAQWIQEHVQRAGGSPQTFRQFAWMTAPVYSLCPRCADRI